VRAFGRVKQCAIIASPELHRGRLDFVFLPCEAELVCGKVGKVLVHAVGGLSHVSNEEAVMCPPSRRCRFARVRAGIVGHG
jgi:hypothetical protein